MKVKTTMQGSLITTFRCNAHCNMCNIWQCPTRPEEEITPEFYKKLPEGLRINITGGEDLGLHEVNTAAELVQRSVDPEANIIFGTVTDTSMEDQIKITVIATGFEKNEQIPNIGMETTVVPKTWEKKINSIPSTSDSNSSQNDLDIPAFLRKNKNKNI